MKAWHLLLSALAVSAVCICVHSPQVTSAQHDVDTSLVLVADLDGNATPDSIRVHFRDGTRAPGGRAIFDRFSIRVGSVDFWMLGEALEGQVELIDVDPDDGLLELAIPQEGPSDDYLVWIVRYEGGALRLVGEIPGTLEDFRIDNRQVNTACRGTILHYWIYPCRFSYDPVVGVYVEVPQAYKPMNTRVRLKEPLIIQESLIGPRRMQTLPRGTEGVIDLTDDVAWCRIRTDQGVVGWFEVRGWEVVETRLGVNETFDGLFQAD